MWAIVMLLAFILVVGLRYRIGTDTVRYETYFRSYPDIFSMNEKVFLKSRFSPLYVLFNVGIRTFTDQFYIFQLIHATIVNTVIFYFFYKNARHFFLAVTLYYLFLYLNINTEVLREALAACAFLLAWPAFKKNNWLVWYIWSIIAFLFHVSALFMFIIPVLQLPGVREFFKFGTRTFYICIGVFMIAMVIQVFLFKYVQAIVAVESVADRASTYSQNELGGAKLNATGIIGVVIIFVIYPLIPLFFQSMQRRMDGLDPVVYNKLEFMTMISVYIAIISTGIFIFMRFNNYFLFFPFVMISDFVFTRLPYKRKYLRLGLASWIIFLIPLFCLEFYTGYLPKVNKSGTLKKYMNYYPYASIFDQDKDEKREKVFKYNHIH
ncbi:MAG: EpsG family protein [Muribaculaceae bacterium]|nr:EpsG family protein [Muribaculaceae bacterium]